MRGAGLNDARGELFYEVLRFVAAHRPAALLLENVPHLLKIDDGAALNTILDEVRRIQHLYTVPSAASAHTDCGYADMVSASNSGRALTLPVVCCSLVGATRTGDAYGACVCVCVCVCACSCGA